MGQDGLSKPRMRSAGQLCEERIDSMGVINVEPNLADFAVTHVHDHHRVPMGTSSIGSPGLHRHELDSMVVARQDVM